MKTTLSEIYYDVEKAIDYAFQGKFVLNFYDYLKIKESIKKEVDQFLESKTVENINQIIIDLESYLEGGNDNDHKQLREAYGHIPKPQARKIKIYLNGIIDDAKRYNYDKRRKGRKRRPK